MPRGTNKKAIAQARAEKQMKVAKAFEGEFMQPFKAGRYGKTTAGIYQKAHAKSSRTTLNAQREASGLKALPSFKKGGVMKKTGLAKLHKGERVLTAKQTKKFKPGDLYKKYQKGKKK